MKTKNLVMSALFVALGILIPMIFHSMGLGKAFLPMHIPVLLAGFILGKKEGFIVGLITPIISSLITSMPPMFPMVPIMTVELAVYGLFAGYFYKDKNHNIFVSLLLTMLIGRVFAGAVVAVLSTFFGFKGKMLPWIIASVTESVPGIILQLILIPTITFASEKVLKENK